MADQRKIERVRALFRMASDHRGASPNEREVAEQKAWAYLQEDPELFDAVADTVLEEANQAGREPEWPTPVFFSIWSKKQQIREEEERKRMAEARAKVEAEVTAAQEEAREARAKSQEARRRRKANQSRENSAPPTPSSTHEPSPDAGSGGRWERIQAGVMDWLGETLEGVAQGLSLTAEVDEGVDVQIKNTAKTITVKATFPVDLALAVHQRELSLEEFSRLVGVKIGAELAAAFKEAGY